jgi:hypothetical protein
MLTTVRPMTVLPIVPVHAARECVVAAAEVVLRIVTWLAVMEVMLMDVEDSVPPIVPAAYVTL